MSTIVTRSGKGSPLTHNEVDANFTNLNSDKTENSAAAITGGSINNTTIGNTTPNAATFTTLTANNATLKGTGQNLVTQSQTYTNSAWNQSTATRLDNQTTAPNGTSTAGTITSTNAVYGGLLRQTPAVTSTTYTLSAYVKKNNWSFVGLRLGSLNGAGDKYAYFNFDTLATSTNGISGATFTATSVGNGWYRIVLSGVVAANAGAACDVAIVASDGSSATNNGAGQSVFVWGVQLELGAVDNTYIPTTTAAVYGTPSLSFSGVASVGLQSDGSLYGTSAGASNVRFYTNNVAQEQMRVSHTASAVNYVQVTGGATTVQPIISAQGSDTNIPLSIRSKGTGALWFGSSDGAIQFSVATTTSSVNRLSVAGAATNTEPVLSAVGTDTNISMAFQSKGTGGISLSTGSTGTNLVNGTSVTAITTTATGSYTSIPSVAISAPTTAGGVQATASVSTMTPTGVIAIVGGGTGYTAGDVLTVSGGTLTSGTTQITVSTVSAGVITAATVTSFGVYSALPSNPASVTGGTGSGATFTINYRLFGALTITNAGSGYVEQPTVTFSGGGGSGAAAYAVVGAATTVRGLGGNGVVAQSISFFTPSGESFRVSTATTSGTSANFLTAAGGVTGNGPRLLADGSDANIFMGLVTKGTGAFQFITNNASEQLRVAHTASAVNYVQVTGAATGTPVIISAQGSDSFVGLSFQAKSASILFTTRSGVQRAFNIADAASTVNWLQVQGATTGNGPTLSSQGTDTNIGLNLTTKGTGAISLNTGGGEQFKVFDTFAGGASAAYWSAYGAASQPRLRAQGSSNAWVETSGTGALVFATNGGTVQQVISHTASAVNYVQVTGAATGNDPVISAQGSDADRNLRLTAKGTGQVATTSSFLAHISATNYIQLSGGASAVSMSAIGASANVNLTLTPKGTGRVQFGTYTATVSTIAGYIEILDSGGTVRRLAVVA